MRTLGIDIETFSSVDLISCGVYAYTSAPDFQILLFGYAWDDNPVEIIDMASGEQLPDEIIQAIESRDVIKTAFNAGFERICLSRHLDKQLKADSWRCTAVQAAMLGLPLHLDGVGTALRLKVQKDRAGKDLIRFFSIPSKPTKSNGGRTRNLPHHAPGKWQMFKDYCIRDVEVEREVRRKIERYPIPEKELKLWLLDQQINDTGVLVDMPLVNQAVKCDTQYSSRLESEAKSLTKLDNPNSVSQLKEWLKEQGLEVESLSKQAVQELLTDADGEIERILSLRQEMAKSSIAKYAAIQRSVCPDNRVRGLFQFYGANRTGRWCLTGDHEVLTKDGWIRLDSWTGGNIACWSPQTEFISFQKAKPLVFDYAGDLYSVESQRCSQLSTPDHRMAYWGKNGGWEVDTVENLAHKRFSIPFTGRRITSNNLEHTELRILIMTQADGHYTQDGDLRFHFSKTRKIERCKSLLRKAGIVFASVQRDKTVVITVKSRNQPIWLRMFSEKTLKPWLLDESADVIFDELEHWDGYRCGPNSIQYSTINKQNADIIQAIAHLSGRAATIIKKIRQEEKWSDAYIVNIWLTPGGRNEVRQKSSKVFYSGKVFCAETETGFFVVRRNGKVWITGNSGRLVQVQNLPQNHLLDLALARMLVKEGRFEEIGLLYDSIPIVLSELIRTAFIPSPGSRFIVADFSAIEARVLAWLANETWVLETFKGHGKIYEHTASRMFGVPVDKITKGNPEYELRATGKVAVLACGYQGGINALKAMGADKMGLSDTELSDIVRAWRSANQRIVRFWYDVEEAAVQAVKERETQRVGVLKFKVENGILFITLPSGRRLAYIRPRIEKDLRFDKDGLTYEGLGLNKQWCRQKTYGGRLVENIVQGTARDCLAEAMLRIDAKGYNIVGHVHDEIITEVPEGQGSLEELCSIMGQGIPWASGLPLKADGFETRFYKKE